MDLVFLRMAVPPTLIQLHAEYQTDRARPATVLENANVAKMRIKGPLPFVCEMKLTKNNPSSRHPVSV
jgi:hypothetical protein